MKTIGIRVAPSAVTYAIFDESKANIVSVDMIVMPKALSTPEALKYIRNTVLDIIREYGIEKAGIRLAEGNAKSVSVDRIRIESVIQEALASSTVENYYCGRIASISSRLGIPSKDFKKYLSDELAMDAIPNWEDHSLEEKEAIFTALGAAHA